ncbi:Uncharacterized membrane protein YkoI [Alteribacillus persepolensis]|uniref:Uncharacterized membrane protein YkoI n=1 Tax=Alteribacillus persepolensis TaxID=568899 RepID=A0A1G8EGN1_9BACI|nr:PepSY domain-containing protein [Alteribacillus persepolensis]SDH69083.1 Uncharacterized membrane protein YkoI [Alteribacillus persepolensis]
MKKLVMATACIGTLGLGVTGAALASGGVSSHQQGDTLSIEEAKEAAQKQYPGTVTEVERETDDGSLFYEIEMVGDEYEYELEIHANTGEVHLDEKEKRESSDDYSNGFTVSMEEAKQIAVDEVGGVIEEIERDKDDGLTYYEIELNTDKGEAEVEVDGHTGDVIEVSYDD